MDVKIVGLLIEGGPDALQMAYANIKRNSPIVVVAKSGKVANILAYAMVHSANSANSFQIDEEENEEENSHIRFNIISHTLHL